MIVGLQALVPSMPLAAGLVLAVPLAEILQNRVAEVAGCLAAVVGEPAAGPLEVAADQEWAGFRRLGPS